MRPDLLQMPEGHTIGRRSAAADGADAPALTEQDGEAYGDTLKTAPQQLSGSSRAVVRVERTWARALAPWQQQPKQQVKPEAAGGAGMGG